MHAHRGSRGNVLCTSAAYTKAGNILKSIIGLVIVVSSMVRHSDDCVQDACK